MHRVPCHLPINVSHMCSTGSDTLFISLCAFFFSLPQKMKSKQWSRFNISLLYQLRTNFSYRLSFVFFFFCFRSVCVFRHQTGNIYKMSRNKDRYESSNPRRQQIFMSQEDVAAGRKSNWTGVEITGEFIHTYRKPTSHALYLQFISFSLLFSSLCLFFVRNFCTRMYCLPKTIQAMYATSVQRCGNSII